MEETTQHATSKRQKIVPQREPLFDPETWDLSYERNVEVLYPLTDELEFSGGACNLSVSPDGSAVVVTSTSLGKLVVVETDTGTLMGDPCYLGQKFPGGAESVVCLEHNKENREGSFVAVVDKKVEKHGYISSSSTRKLHLRKEWSVDVAPTVECSSTSVSLDAATGTILVSDSPDPGFRIRAADGEHLGLVPHDQARTGDKSFHRRCIATGWDCEGQSGSGPVVTLPNNNLLFLNGLFLIDEEEPQTVSLGLLREGERRIEKIKVNGLNRKDFFGKDFGHFCVNSNGDVFGVLTILDAPKQPLICITNPTRSGECRGKLSMIEGFGRFEEFGGIAADRDNCVYLLVVNVWPFTRTICLLNPKENK